MGNRGGVYLFIWGHGKGRNESWGTKRSGGRGNYSQEIMYGRRIN